MTWAQLLPGVQEGQAQGSTKPKWLRPGASAQEIDEQESQGLG